MVVAQLSVEVRAMRIEHMLDLVLFLAAGGMVLAALLALIQVLPQLAA